MKKDGVVQRSCEGGARLLPLAAALIAVFATVYGSRAAQAQSVEASGDVSPGIPASPLSQWVVGSNLTVGNLGTGTLSIENGGSVSSTGGTIGSRVGSQGTVTVSGKDSAWTNSSQLTVGDSGTGTLSIGNGGTVSNTDGWIGSRVGSEGTVTVSGLGSAWTNSGSLYVGDYGTGTLHIESGGTVSNISSWIGTFAGSEGSVTVSGLDSAWTNSGQLSVGDLGTGILSIENGGTVSSTSGWIGSAAGNQGTVTVFGSGSAWTNFSSLIVGNLGTGTLSIEDGGTVSNIVGFVGRAAGGQGTVTVSGLGSTWTNSSQLTVGDAGVGTLAVADGGRVSVQAGVGTLKLAAGNGSTGTIHIGAASPNPTAATAAGRLEAATITFGAGAGTLNFNHIDSHYDFGAALRSTGSGTHTLNQYAGVTRLTADSATFRGTTTVSGGALIVANTLGGAAVVNGGRFQVDGNFAGPVAVEQTGTLSGAGTLASDAIFSAGGVLAGTQGQTLTIGGNLVLDQASQVNVALGGAPTNTLFDVGGNLQLDGTLNVSNQGGFGAGVYRLFNYGGALIDNGLTLGKIPAGVDANKLDIQTAVYGQVNLVSTGGVKLDYWDGDDTGQRDNGAVDGGAGIWRADGDNWTDVNGAANGPFVPSQSFPVFQGTGATVTVDHSAGAVGVAGMQLATNGYYIKGDSIALEGQGGESIIRVGDGSAASASMIGTIASSLTGASKLVKSDLGTLVLAGANSYTGDTEIRAGVLAVSADTNLGAAPGALTLNGGTLATTASFDTARAITLGQAGGIAVAGSTALGLNGTISGAGELTKTGTGQLNVTGDGSAFTGHTQVQNGTLSVGIQGQGQLGGTLTIYNGATLQGTGTVGTSTLQSGGTIAPGNSIGTLTVAGDLNFAPNSTYQLEVDLSSNNSDRIVVSGTANLAGSLALVGPQGGFTSTRQYTILSANLVQGQFDAIDSNYTFLSPTLRYGAQDVTLQLERKQVVDPVDPDNPSTRPIAFADAAKTSNQHTVAKALDSLPAGNVLHEYILTLSDGEPPAAFDNLSGEIHASVQGSLIGSGVTTRTVPLTRLRSNLAAGLSAGAPTAQAGGSLPSSALPESNAQPAWAELVGSWQTQQGDGNAAQVKQRTGGVFVGADHAVGAGWRVGGALGYTDGDIRVDERASKADVASYSAILYGGKSFELGTGKLNLLAGAAYTRHDVDTKRMANVAGTSQRLTADYQANTTQLFTELGYAMALSERASIEPFAGLAWSHLRTPGFSESGGSAALSRQRDSDTQTSTTLGVRAQTGFTLGQAEGQLRATLGWRHAFGEVVPHATMAFEGGQNFTVAGAPLARNTMLAELGVDMAIARNATVGLNYSGQYGDGSREHAGSINLRWRY